MAGLPTADPQFWLVTAGAALAVVFIVRRARAKSAPDSGAPPCEHCASHPSPPPDSRPSESRSARAGRASLP